MPTVARILELTPPSCYLAANRTAKGALFGPPVDPRLPLTIYLVYKILKRVYDADPTYTGVRVVADYLYELIQRYAFKAAAIVDNNTGGQIAPASGVTVPNPYDFEVEAASFIPTGDDSVTISQFIGYNVNFSRGGIMQNTTNLGDGSSYYSWNLVTGLFTIFPAASEGELFRIMVDAGGGSSSVIPTQSFPIVITSADFEADGVTYLNSNIASVAGNNVYLLANNTPNPILFAPTDFIYVAGGIQIILAGFDANTFNYTIAINQIN